MNINQIPLWNQLTVSNDYSCLNGENSCDIAIIGGGITGITIAGLLSEHGLKISVLEASKIGSGTTGKSTAKITVQHQLRYKYLLENLGHDRALLYFKANQMGLDKIAQIIKANDIDCNFKRASSYVYTDNIDDVINIESEQNALKKLGVNSEITDKTELPFNVEKAIVLDNQAQFNPQKYINKLAENFNNHKDCNIYENSKVIQIEKGNICSLKTENAMLKADTVILATNYPIMILPGLYFTRLYQQRSYIIAYKTDKKKIDGMYINSKEPVNSIRMHNTKDADYLLLGGYGHKTGQQKEYDNGYKKLHQLMKDRFNSDPKQIYQWSAQDCVTLDKIPYVGKMSLNTPNIYIATGYGKWGMTNSTASAIIIADEIMGTNHALDGVDELFSPQRFILKASAKPLIKMTGDTIKEFIVGNLFIEESDIADVKKGTGKIIKLSSKVVAVYKDEEDNVSVFNAHCTHMKCPLTYNEAEKSFDCQCHGSRFSMTGKVLEGPAIDALEPLEYNIRE